MDEQYTALLVERVEQAFPGDFLAQRKAWEFIEMVLAVWEEAQNTSLTTEVVSPQEETNDLAVRMLNACRSILASTNGRLVSAVQVLFPQTPGVAVLSRAEAPQTIHVDLAVASEVGIDPDLTVEYGFDFVTLIARVREGGTPGRLGAIIHTAEAIPTVQRFEFIDSQIASAHVEFPESASPVGVVVALVDTGA